MTPAAWSPLAGSPVCALGESVLWHPVERVLYWCDIPARRLHRHDVQRGHHRHWALPSEPGCIVPRRGGGVVLALRHGVFGTAPDVGQNPSNDLALTHVADAPFDGATMRFNDGRADAMGRLWLGTIHEPRDAAVAAVWCLDVHASGGPQWHRKVDGMTVCNGVAFSPDDRTLYVADTTTHRIDAHDFDVATATVGPARPFARFALRVAGASLDDYAGRPDGAAMDAEGCLWVAMFEGSQIVRLAPDGRVLARLPLPVRCATMPCFGGPDGRTLFVTTARHNRPAEECVPTSWAGRVLQAVAPIAGHRVHLTE